MHALLRTLNYVALVAWRGAAVGSEKGAPRLGSAYDFACTDPALVFLHLPGAAEQPLSRESTMCGHTDPLCPAAQHHDVKLKF